METTNKTYFTWLCSLVEDDKSEKIPFDHMMRALHHVDFISLVPNDDNRAKDGEDLRIQFMERYESLVPPLSKNPCTVLEMLIALARRMEEIMAGEVFELTTSQCFWLFIHNLDLEVFSDHSYYIDHRDLFELRIRRYIDRQYSYNGHGGIFPLKKAKRDQRKTEIWYQMADYLLENYSF